MVHGRTLVLWSSNLRELLFIVLRIKHFQKEMIILPNVRVWHKADMRQGKVC